MTTQLAALMEKMRTVEAEIEGELARRREEFRFRLDNRRIVFEEEALRLFIVRSRPGHPAIYCWQTHLLC